MSRPHGTAPRDLAAAGSPAGSGGELPAAGSQPAAPKRPAITAMWQLSIVTLARLALLCGAGVLLRLAIGPGPAVAVTAWIAATALSAVPMYRLTSPHARARRPRPPGTWQPGEEPPEGVPAATIQAATQVFAQLPSPWAAWLKIAPCTDPAGHDGMCLGAGAEPAGGGMMSVVLGEHIAGDPADAGFVLAHETRHPVGWQRHLSLATTAARQAGWLAAGWAVPWPWLPAALAAIQGAYTVACWVTEAGCDLAGARIAGRDAALGFLARRQALARQPKPGRALRRRAVTLLNVAAVPAAHPPWRVRSLVVRALGPGGGQA